MMLQELFCSLLGTPFFTTYSTILLIYNRSPIDDPKSKGIISGLTLDTSEKNLALLYLATVQSIA
jgi:hypothetical protein